MLTITGLKMWKDPGYTKGCLEIPPAGSTLLPAPDWQSSGPLRPRKHSTLTAVELPLPYTEVWEMSYLHMTAEDGSGEMEVYGWIDAVTITASSADAVRIDWTPDWWRTCSGRVMWGPGRINRCSDSTLKRPLGIQPRYRTAAPMINIRSTDGLLWVIISYRMTDSQRTLLIIPCDPDLTDARYTIEVANPGTQVYDTAQSPSLAECISGALPSLLGIQSTSIDGAWVSSISPLNDNTWYSEDEKIICNYTHYSLQKGETYAAIKCVGYRNQELSALYYKEITIKDPRVLETTDLVTYAIADVYGNIIGTAPYGVRFTQLDCVLDIGNISATIKVTLNTSSDTIADKTAEGMTITVPLPSVPISSSATSDYAYSGQRDYEMHIRELQSERQAVNGISGVATGAIGGAIAGSVVPGAGTVAGALVGGIGSALGVGVQYLADTEIYNDRIQDLEDRRYANQSGNLMIAGDGYGWMLYNKWPRLISLTADPVFQSEVANHILQEGYPCDSPVADVTQYITAGGPLRITNLTITGAVPPAAKRSIKALLAGGVRIVEHNNGGA